MARPDRFAMSRLILFVVMGITPIGGLIGLKTGWFSGYSWDDRWGTRILGMAYVATPLAKGAFTRWPRVGRRVLAGLTVLYLLAGLRFYLAGTGPVLLSVVAAMTVLVALAVFPPKGNRSGEGNGVPPATAP